MAEAAWKPWAAGLLVAGAIAMIGRNLVMPLLHREPQVVSPSTPATTPVTTVQEQNPPQQPSLSDTTPASADSSRLAGWIEEEDRDPFGSRIQKMRQAESEEKHIPSPDSHAKKRHGIRIGAIAWGKDKMALVDGVVVRPGDTLAEGILLGIYPDRLALRSPVGDTILRFREGGAL